MDYRFGTHTTAQVSAQADFWNATRRAERFGGTLSQRIL